MAGGCLNQCPSDMKASCPAKTATALQSQGGVFFFFFSSAIDFIGDLERLTSFLFFCFCVSSIFLSTE